MTGSQHQEWPVAIVRSAPEVEEAPSVDVLRHLLRLLRDFRSNHDIPSTMTPATSYSLFFIPSLDPDYCYINIKDSTTTLILLAFAAFLSTLCFPACYLQRLVWSRPMACSHCNVAAILISYTCCPITCCYISHHLLTCTITIIYRYRCLIGWIPFYT